MSRAVDVIVDKLPPPGKLRGSSAEDAADGGADDAQEGDYNAAEDSMGAFLKAIGVDPAKAPAAIDAFRDLMKNC